MRGTLSIFCRGIVFLVATQHACVAWISMSPCAQYYEWNEKSVSVEERGVLPGILLQGEELPGDRWGWRWGLTLFFGEVGYDGAKQDFTPYRTKTLYAGGDLRAGAFGRWPVGDDAEFQPLAGLGARIWKRRLDNTDQIASGYDEDWANCYALAGVRLLRRVGPDQNLSLEGGLRRSLATYEQLHLLVAGHSSRPTLNPSDRTSAYAAAAWRKGDYLLTVFAEGLHFGTSEMDRFGFYQPASDGKVVGIGLGVIW